MKLQGGTIDGLITEWARFQYNSHYGKGCRNYTIPLYAQHTNVPYWYIEFPKTPQSLSYKFIDPCSCTYGDADIKNYVVGTNTDGVYYAVLNGFTTPPITSQFILAVEVIYGDGTRQWFYSQTYEYESECTPVEVLYACYSPTDNGGFDANGVYYGLPATTVSGNPTMRYFHNYTLRGLAATYGGKKILYTMFANKPTKSESETQYNILGEVVPYWYLDALAEAYSRGIVYVGTAKYTIKELTSEIIGDDCCERLMMKVVAVRNFTTTFSCSLETCTPSACLPPTMPATTFNACNGALVAQSVQISGTQPFTLAYTPVAGFNVSLSGGTLSVSGTANGVTDIPFSITNCDTTANFTITVNGVCCQPTVSGMTNTLPAATINTAYTQSYNVLGSPTIVLNVVNKPTWMTVSLVNGLLTFSGTPTASGTQTVQINLTNDCNSIDYNLSLFVDGVVSTATQHGITIYQSTSAFACGAPISPIQVFTSASNNIPTIGLIFYTNSALTTQFASGYNGWFGVIWNGSTNNGVKYAMQINNGVVQSIVFCP